MVSAVAPAVESPTMSYPAVSPAGKLFHLLVVADSEPLKGAYCDAAAELFHVRSVNRRETAIAAVQAQPTDVVIMDLRLPQPDLQQLLKEIKTHRPTAEIIIATAEATVSGAVEAMRLGAFDYLVKPFTLQELSAVLERVAEHMHTTRESRLLQQSLRTNLGFGNIVGSSPEMEKLYRIITKAGHSSHPVLILGESGTGKEMVARSIHYSGAHRDKPFIPVDCGSLVPTLIEAELFGYVKGAFTGAARSKEGLLTVANGGTVFLDEIGELPLDLQAKLLRALQEKEIRPVGSTQTQHIDVRILAATNRNLEAAVEQGSFRKDLFYRLNVLTLRIPPLRDRMNDIPLLARHFLARLSRASGRQYTLTEDAMQLLLSYDWQAEVRRIEKALRFSHLHPECSPGRYGFVGHARVHFGERGHRAYR